MTQPSRSAVNSGLSHKTRPLGHVVFNGLWFTKSAKDFQALADGTSCIVSIAQTSSGSLRVVLKVRIFVCRQRMELLNGVCDGWHGEANMVFSDKVGFRCLVPDEYGFVGRQVEGKLVRIVVFQVFSVDTRAGFRAGAVPDQSEFSD